MCNHFYMCFNNKNAIIFNAQWTHIGAINVDLQGAFEKILGLRIEKRA